MLLVVWNYDIIIKGIYCLQCTTYKNISINLFEIYFKKVNICNFGKGELI